MPALTPARLPAALACPALRAASPAQPRPALICPAAAGAWARAMQCFMGLVINDFEGRTGWTCNPGQTGSCMTTGDQIIAR